MPSQRVRRAFADTILTATATPRFRVFNTTVTAVSAGTSLDGNAEVSITLGGASVKVAYAASYSSPTVGDLVRVEISDGSPFITCKVTGRPTI